MERVVRASAGGLARRGAPGNRGGVLFCYAKVAATLPKLSYGLPATTAVHQVTEAIEAARVAAALPASPASPSVSVSGGGSARR